MAVGLIVISAVVVVAALASSTAVGLASLVSLAAGAVSSRMVYTELTQTRRDAALDRAALSRDFGTAMTRTHAEHAQFTAVMTSRIAGRDTAIVELHRTVHLAELRAVEAEARVTREAKRANDAQERLSTLLDEVLTQQAEVLAGVGIPEAAELPAIADLLAWEDHAGAALLDEARHQA
jgi:hypothetical protein